MSFASLSFIFFFLPMVVLVYYVLKPSWRNIFLFFVSVIFYFLNQRGYVVIILCSVIVNYLFGRLLEKCKNRIAIGIGIGVNILILFIFKYETFLIENINAFFHLNLYAWNLVLPAGISFYTFQVISYIVDVYAKRVKAQHKLTDMGLYLSFFPQLIAGPIVRYSKIEPQLTSRIHSFERFYIGIQRLMIGFCKKILLANNLGKVVEKVFIANVHNQSVMCLWLGALSFALQIYFDFSGYTDMAIGIGKMFGFDFEENFNYPYMAKSIGEFWRRWHITLGAWFRDYVYIPLGGSRISVRRTVFNLFLVWSLTGLWHGAAWHFIIWGLYYFILLIIEKLLIGANRVNRRKTGGLGHLFTLFLVVIGWVIFKSESIGYAVVYIKGMFGLNDNPFWDTSFKFLFSNCKIVLLVAGCLSFPIYKKLLEFIERSRKCKLLWKICEMVTLFVLGIVSVSFLIMDQYNPFLYFMF